MCRVGWLDYEVDRHMSECMRIYPNVSGDILEILISN